NQALMQPCVLPDVHQLVAMQEIEAKQTCIRPATFVPSGRVGDVAAGKSGRARSCTEGDLLVVNKKLRVEGADRSEDLPLHQQSVPAERSPVAGFLGRLILLGASDRWKPLGAACGENGPLALERLGAEDTDARVSFTFGDESIDRLRSERCIV